MDHLLNIVPCGILVFDDGGTILSVNKTAADLLGYAPDAMQRKSVDIILSPASRIFYSTHFFPLIKLRAKAEEIFLTLVSSDKREIPVLCNATRHLNAGSYENVAVFIPVFQRHKYEEEILIAKRTAERALTENNELQTLTQTLELRTQELEKQNQRLEAVNQDLVQFSRIISHDLQEPIRKIRLFSDILSSSVNEAWSPRNVSDLGKIENSAERLKLLTQGLQEYVAVGANESRTKVDLNDSVTQALKKVNQKRDFDSFQLISDRLPTIDGYSIQLELLFLHLLDNAIQFRQPDKGLVIRIACTLLEENLYRSIEGRYKFADHARIIFSDNGTGFDNQYNDYVFDLTKKVHGNGKGLGFGLALIKKIVDNHHGTVKIESAPGKGTDVTLVLPLVANGPEAGFES